MIYDGEHAWCKKGDGGERYEWPRRWEILKVYGMADDWEEGEGERQGVDEVEEDLESYDSLKWLSAHIAHDHFHRTYINCSYPNDLG